MKKLTSLIEVLAFQLDAMYDGEKKIQHQLPTLSKNVDHPKLQEAAAKYVEHAIEKRSKLKRIFTYLLVPSSKRENLIVDSIFAETGERLNAVSTVSLRDAVLAACVQTINHYNIANYTSALAFAIELNLDAVADLLHEILAWERETEAALQKIVFEGLHQKSPGAV
ncbi:MAG TPA: DUF892 family protein [Chryseolinea sp.]